MIWDTGEYEILPRRSKYAPATDPESASDSEPNTTSAYWGLSEPEKLAAAFQNRKIRLRLHGTRLPKNYTLNLRLTKKENRTEQPKKPTRKRKRVDPTKKKKAEMEETPPPSDLEADEDEVVASQPKAMDPSENTSALEKELQEQEDEAVRLTNAYPGATNSINSIHQRKWYLSLDRVASGFGRVKKGKRMWWERLRGDNGQRLGFESFFVMGRDDERSVVTGRVADEVMGDEGVVGYLGRKLWRPVME